MSERDKVWKFKNNKKNQKYNLHSGTSNVDSKHFRSADDLPSWETYVELPAKKMSDFYVFMAICKGYCAINILILPKNVSNGGWLIGLISIWFAMVFVTVTALKLIKCGLHTKQFKYQLIVYEAFGQRGKTFVDIVLCFVQFSFSIAQISFTLEAMVSLSQHKVNMWIFAAVLVGIYTPIAWVRRLEYFKVGYTIGMAMILYTAVFISVYCVKDLVKYGPKKEGFKMINTEKMWDMIGFSFYSFEGIGTLLPIM